MRDAAVYVLDDDRFYLNLCQYVLGSVGCNPAQSISVEAIDWAVLQDASLLLLDLMMPGCDGFDLIEQLEARNFRGSVLLMTGVDLNGVQPAIERLLTSRLLIAGILHKPFSREQLLHAVTQALAREDVLPFSADSRDLLELAIESASLDLRFLPVINSGDGSIAALSVNVAVHMGGHCFTQQRLDDLLLYSGLADAFIDTLLECMLQQSVQHAVPAGAPMDLYLPPRLCMNAATLASLRPVLERHVEKGLKLRIVVCERDLLLYGPALLRGLRELRAQGFRLVLDQVVAGLAHDALPALGLFDELRLAAADRSGTRYAASAARLDPRLLEKLHRQGYALTVRGPDALYTLGPAHPFNPDFFLRQPSLQADRHGLRAALGLA